MSTRIFRGLAAAAVCAASAIASAQDYDPLAAPAANVERLELKVQDGRRQRVVPLRVYLPASHEPAAVVLFSHGLGGSREGNAFMGEHWANRGYVAVFLQHPGSDSSVWRDVPAAQRMGSMKKAANVQNFILRVEDVHATIDALERWNVDPKSPLRGRLDLAQVGMSGHSFGAITTQAVSGQRYGKDDRARDRRIKAAIMFSPSAPRRGDPESALAGVDIPWMLMTGTDDNAPIGAIDAAARQKVFPALPPGHKYEVVLDRAEHSAFTDRALPGDKQQRNPNHHRAILALSTAFWDAYLRGDAKAREWLDGDGPRSVLETKDRWQRK